MMRYVFTTFAWLAISLPAVAATIYVDDDSSNGDGSQARPFASIQEAANVAAPGDTVLVQPGDYGPFRVLEDNGAGANGQYVTYRSAEKHAATISEPTDGSQHHCIYIRNSSYVAVENFRLVNCADAGIRIEGRWEGNSRYKGYKARGFRISGNYIENTGTYAIGVSGEAFGADNKYEPLYVNGVEARDVISDVIIENNVITRTNEPDGSNECISVGRGLSGFTIRNNYIYESDQYGIDAKMGAQQGRIYGNKIVNVEKHGIYLDTANHYVTDMEVFNNTIIWDGRSPRGYDGSSGISLTRENKWDQEKVLSPTDLDGDGRLDDYIWVDKDYDRPAHLDRIRIYNNAIYNPDSDGIQIYEHCYEQEGDCGGRDPGQPVNPDSTFSDIDIFNNTVIKRTDDEGNKSYQSIKVDHPDTANVRIFNNITGGEHSRIINPKQHPEFNNLVAGNDTFADFANLDFHLRASSPAVDAGSGEANLDFDLECRSRDSRVDLGAYELDEGQPRSGAPSCSVSASPSSPPSPSPPPAASVPKPPTDLR